MKVSKSRWAYSIKEGTDTEKRFKTLIESKGYEVVKSSKKQDIQDHIDFYVNGYGIDVKGRRYTKTIWLEIQNVKGKDGWLKGKAKYIVFDILDLESFVFFYREDLLKYVEQYKETTENKNDYLKWYSRKKWNREDKIIKVKYQHIKHLEIKKYNYATT